MTLRPQSFGSVTAKDLILYEDEDARPSAVVSLATLELSISSSITPLRAIKSACLKPLVYIQGFNTYYLEGKHEIRKILQLQIQEQVY